MEAPLGQVMAREENLRPGVEARLGSGADDRVGSDPETSARLAKALTCRAEGGCSVKFSEGSVVFCLRYIMYVFGT